MASAVSLLRERGQMTSFSLYPPIQSHCDFFPFTIWVYFSYIYEQK